MYEGGKAIRVRGGDGEFAEGRFGGGVGQGGVCALLEPYPTITPPKKRVLHSNMSHDARPHGKFRGGEYYRERSWC